MKDPMTQHTPSEEQIRKDRQEIELWIEQHEIKRLPQGVAQSALFFYKGSNHILQSMR